MRSTDPNRMSREDILAELGELLAVGYQRHISSSMRHPVGDKEAQKELDVFASSEAQCGKSKRKSKCKSPTKSPD